MMSRGESDVMAAGAHLLQKIQQKLFLMSPDVRRRSCSLSLVFLARSRPGPGDPGPT